MAARPECCLQWIDLLGHSDQARSYLKTASGRT